MSRVYAKSVAAGHPDGVPAPGMHDDRIARPIWLDLQSQASGSRDICKAKRWRGS
jgi:hypothetical protein